MSDLFPVTRELIPIWDRVDKKLDEVFKAIETQEDFNRWESLHKDHVKVLQGAFGKDTEAFNSMGNCFLVSPDWIKKTVLGATV